MPRTIDDKTAAIANQLIADCSEWEGAGQSAFPAESYEAGVKAALMWILGQSTDVPEVEKFEGDED